MEKLVLQVVLVVLSAGISAADPPNGLYITEGVSYVGCFEHGQPHHEEVLNIQTNPDCSSNHRESCLTPSTCIHSCQSTNSSYLYIGLKYPGQCFCDSVLRGVSQTDSVDGIYCDAMCLGDLQFACGAVSNMLVYRWSNIPTPTSSVNITYATGTPVLVYTTRPEAVSTTTDREDIKNQPRVNTGLVAGVTVGATVFVVIILSAVYIYMRRKKTTGDKSSGTERTHYVNGQFLDDEQRARTNQEVPDRNRPIPTPQCDSSDVYLEPGVPMDDHEYTYIDNRYNALSSDDSNYVNQPTSHRYVNASETCVGRDSVVYEDVVPRRNREERSGQYINVGYSHNEDGTYVNM
ncbi:uncharacterized protein LOC144879586 [Branchiostoma floridae x Branchiostoma japonicum]